MVLPSTSSSPAFAAGPTHHSVAMATEQLVSSDLHAAMVSTAVKAANATKKSFSTGTRSQASASLSSSSSSSEFPSQSSDESPSSSSPSSSSSSHHHDVSSSRWFRPTPSQQHRVVPSSPSTPSSSDSSTATASSPGNSNNDHDAPTAQHVSSDYESSNAEITINNNNHHSIVAASDEIDELLDWESWKKDTPFWLHAAAGSCAGVVEHSIMYSVDTIKTRIQALSQSHGTRTATVASTTVKQLPLRDIWRELYMESGFRGFFRGLPAVWAGCIPAHAALFTVYEFAKAEFSTSNPLSSALCGGLATVSHDFILTPTDVVKQRLQLGCYNGAIDCVKTTFRVEGWRAFYRSMPTTLFMNVPFGAILVTANEGLKHWFGLEKLFEEKRRQNINTATTHQNNVTQCESLNASCSEGKILGSLPAPLLASYFLSAGIAGGIAGSLTTPLDVIKTRLQTQDIGLRGFIHHRAAAKQPSNIRLYSTQIGSDKARQFQSHQCHTWVNRIKHVAPSNLPIKPQQPRYTNFLSTVKLIYMEEGARGFWKGTSARLALSVPSAAICWGTYESVKYLFMRNLLEQ